MAHHDAKNPDGHELDSALNWITAHPWLLAAGILCILHVSWLVLAPPGTSLEQRLGLALYGVYAVFAAVRYALRAHAAIRTVFLVPALLSLAVSALYAVSFLPAIETVARFRGATYLITSSNVFLGWGRPDRQLIVWKSPIKYTVHSLGNGGPEYRITYDRSNDAVNIVAPAWNNSLVCSDGLSFRCFQGELLQGDNRYYVSPQCNQMGKNWCVTTTYTMYKCQPDNASCVQLPMVYTAGGDGYVNLRPNPTTGEIDFYLESDLVFQDPGILVYTYGAQPVCHISGCYIIGK